MIPFGALMQAAQAAGSMPAMGNGGPGTGNPAATQNRVGQTGGDASESFAGWVRKLTGDETAMASNGENTDHLQDEATELEAIDWDQLTSMIADAMERPSELSADGQTVNGIDISAIQDVMQQLADTDISTVEGHALQALATLAVGSATGSHPATNPGSKAMAAVKAVADSGQQGLAQRKWVTRQETPDTQPEGQALGRRGMAQAPPGTEQEGQAQGKREMGQAPTGAEPERQTHGKRGMGQTPTGAEQEGKARGKGATVFGAGGGNAAKPGLTTVTEPGEGAGSSDKTRTETQKVAFNQASQAQQDKEKPASPFEATVAQPTETAEEESPVVNARRSNDETNKSLRGDDWVSSQKDPRQARQSIAVSTGRDDGHSPTADEDRSDNRRVVRGDLYDRNQSSDAGEKELLKGATSSEPIKTASPEPHRFSDTIQDATRTMSEKSGVIQTAPSEGTKASVPQRFQATVMDQIVDKANLRSVQGRSEIQIRLKPDFLGNVQMNISADKEQLVVRMITDHPVVKDVVEANLHQLKTELQHQGLTIDRFEVTVNPDAGQQQNREQFAQMFKNPSFQNGRGQEPEAEPETHHRENGNREDNHRRGGDQPGEEGINYFA